MAATEQTVTNPMDENGSIDPEMGTNDGEPADHGRFAANPDIASVMARLGTAPTNWHQATVYFLTSKAEGDASSRKRAPFFFAWGFLLVVLQILAADGVLLGMVNQSCGNNDACVGGMYCHVTPGRTRGRCLYCGESAPLVAYDSDIPVPGEPGKFKYYNRIETGSYPQKKVGFGREIEPTMFAGWNMTHVRQRCRHPYRSFKYAYEYEVEGDSRRVVVTDSTDIPDGIQPRDWGSPVSDFMVIKDFSEATVERWCDSCVQMAPDGILDVSVMNMKLLAQTNQQAMAPLDWAALVLCSYVVGLTIVGEIKDMALCEMAIERNKLELSQAWLIWLEILNRLRSAFFLQPLCASIPVVVLTQGGGAMATCFNTIAVLFITEVRFEVERTCPL